MTNSGPLQIHGTDDEDMGREKVVGAGGNGPGGSEGDGRIIRRGGGYRRGEWRGRGLVGN